MSTWIFQGNPEVFDIDGYLAASAGLIKWRVTRYADQIAEGDSAYLWRSQGEDAPLAGILAEGTIAELPAVQKDDPASAAFWKQKPKDDEVMRVTIRLNRIASKKEILKREWMKDDSALKNLLILRQPSGTNFPVEDDEAKRLGQLWRKTGSDWQRDEVIAALWLYTQLLGKPISKIAGSEVERVSQQIGRAPTGVYNKLMNLRSIDPRDKRKGLDGASEIDEETWDDFFDAASQTLDGNRLADEFRRLWDKGVKADKLAEESLEDEEERLAAMTTAALLREYANRPPNERPKRRSQETTTYDRDPMVVTLRKRLASYRCEVEGCQSARFQTGKGEFFVEVHHLVQLSEGGPDTLQNTVALCPTHHRLLHHGKQKTELADELTKRRKIDPP